MDEYLNLGHVKDPSIRLNDLNIQLQDIIRQQQTAEAALQQARIDNLKEEYNQRIEFSKHLAAKGYDEDKQLSIIKAVQEQKQLEQEYALKLKNEKNISAARRKEILAELAQKKKQALANNKELSKLEQKEVEAQTKKKLKDNKKIAQDFFKEQNKLGTLGTFIGPSKEAEAEMRAKLAEEGNSEAEIEQAIAAAKLQAKADAAMDALGNFAKQLEGTMKSVNEAQTEIDTRLYGSGLKKTMGSYWRQMEWNIGTNVGVSPFVKQEDVVSNLRNLVSKGIAFNVEQRAFLETISDKIATTFEAADGTLLKLIRIQQADTTAARLGMEAALNEFLNNMYQTTEYMTEAAASVRQSLYEASALMKAEDATAFEYQVQKWLGSLHSVGFNNTQGLADALGKLVAGDVTSITSGGFGNLLVMAATQANIPITKALNEGLNSDETNMLLQSVVEYLADIYNETQGSKVVAQQYANVFGITASDLKAAANLVESTSVISKQTMNYGGMMQNLTDMAKSMVSRTSISTMVANVIDNFKYSIAASMGANPVLYSTYTIASMLDSVAGGIQIPAFSVMGNMVDLDTSVADLMRVASVSGGILSGIGKIIVGLAKGSAGGAGMLKAFGIQNDKITTIARGTGVGLAPGLKEISGESEKGYIGNESGSDVKQKTMDDANNEADEEFKKKKEEYEQEETTLKVVDEHILAIYNLFMTLSGNGNALKVTFGDPLAWSSIPGYNGGGGF